ncbi:MAG: SGNH/GDSL hydrolase family protein [Bacillota bacterium]|nr:SGNH/GDSL hydrolase family protein [Bacillota bacterium]
MVRYYVALGDSVAAGFRAAPGYGYVDQLYRHLRERSPDWRLANLALPGATTWNLGSQVRRAITYRPHLITLDIGGNDLRRAGPDPSRIIPYSMQNLEAALGALRRHTRAAIFIADVYNPLPPGSRLYEQARVWIGRFNAALARVAARHRCRVVPIGAVLAHSRGMIALDRLHPSTAGHSAIAAAFLRAGVGSLR